MSSTKPSLTNGSSTPMLCGHCGRYSVFQIRGEGTQHGYARWKDPIKALQQGIDGQTIITWRILECTICNKPTLVQEVIISDFNDIGGEDIRDTDVTVLYPRTRTTIALTDLPPSIAKEYEIVLKVQNISSNLCAMQLRRTLEAIFNHEKAQGKTLELKVDDLLKSANIPPLLAGMAHLGRHIGNLGAHADEVAEEDITVFLDFIEVILIYLYTTPTKVVAFKEKLMKTP